MTWEFLGVGHELRESVVVCLFYRWPDTWCIACICNASVLHVETGEVNETHFVCF
mgnify:CR=1 FL=1